MRIHGGKGAQPNAAHRALAELEALAQSVTIVTSNVDPLHQRAGSRHVYRLHGDILQTRCLACREVGPLDIEGLPERVSEETLPRCPCGGRLRPNVVWFGETPWPEAFEAVRRELPQADLVLEVGSSGVVSYGFTQIAVQLGRPVLRINPEADEEQGVHCIRQPAEVALPELVRACRKLTIDD
jgi:NAD-dependent deacetylase